MPAALSHPRYYPAVRPPCARSGTSTRTSREGSALRGPRSRHVHVTRNRPHADRRVTPSPDPGSPHHPAGRQPGRSRRPVLLSLASFAPARDRPRAWLRRRIAADYRALADAETFGPSAIDDLRADGRVLTGAAVVTPTPVRPDDAVTLFRLATHPAPRQEHWDVLAGHLVRHPDGPTAQALTNPLVVALARTAYADAPGDPTELTDTGRFPTPAAVEHHLLDAFVPTLCTRAHRYDTARRRRAATTGHLRPGLVAAAPLGADDRFTVAARGAVDVRRGVARPPDGRDLLRLQPRQGQLHRLPRRRVGWARGRCGHRRRLRRPEVDQEPQRSPRRRDARVVRSSGSLPRPRRGDGRDRGARADDRRPVDSDPLLRRWPLHRRPRPGRDAARSGLHPPRHFSRVPRGGPERVGVGALHQRTARAGGPWTPAVAAPGVPRRSPPPGDPAPGRRHLPVPPRTPARPPRRATRPPGRSVGRLDPATSARGRNPTSKQSG